MQNYIFLERALYKESENQCFHFLRNLVWPPSWKNGGPNRCFVNISLGTDFKAKCVDTQNNRQTILYKNVHTFFSCDRFGATGATCLEQEVIFPHSENRGTDVGVVSHDRAGQSKQKWCNTKFSYSSPFGLYRVL